MKAKWIIGTIVAVGIVGLLWSLRVRTQRDAATPGTDRSQPSASELAPASLKEHFAAKPGIVTPSDNTASETARYTNLVTRLMKGEEAPRLTHAEAEAFVQQNRRRVEALLAAFQSSSDSVFLHEAMEKYPNDPRVALAAATLSKAYDSEEEFLQARRGWLDAFKQSAPDNALADYLSAREHFQTGQPELALQEVMAAAGKPMRDYALDWIQNTEEAYRAAGYSDAEAKGIAATSLLLPQLAQMRDVGKSLVEMSKNSRASGDDATAQALLQTASHLGSRLDSSGTFTLIQSLVGVAIQRNVLSSLEPGATFGDSAQTVQAQLDQLAQRRDNIRGMVKQFEQVFPRLSEQDLSTYFDRLKLFGDEAASQWVVSKYNP
jgi:hypothetical protein